MSNPIAVERWPLRTVKGENLLWVGRMDADKGPHRAITAARLAGRTLVLAGPIQPGEEEYFAEEVEPQLDGRQVRYMGEVGGAAKQKLFAGAAALLMPIRWREPFGMVMVEALACGTPVIAFPEGTAAEIGDRRARTAYWCPTRPGWHMRSTASAGSIVRGAARAWPSATTCWSASPAMNGSTGGRSMAADDPGSRPRAERWLDASSVRRINQHEPMTSKPFNQGKTRAPAPRGRRDQSRALRLLEANQHGGLTIAVLRERGIEAPARPYTSCNSPAMRSTACPAIARTEPRRWAIACELRPCRRPADPLDRRRWMAMSSKVSCDRCRRRP